MGLNFACNFPLACQSDGTMTLASIFQSPVSFLAVALKGMGDLDIYEKTPAAVILQIRLNV